MSGTPPNTAKQSTAAPDQSGASDYGSWVEINFDCLPLRSIAPVSISDEASPKLAAKLQRLQAAIEKHGTLNSYYLHNACCIFHLTNDPGQGMLRYSFEGVILTDAKDMQACGCDLQAELTGETCGWLNQAIADWFGESVQRAVLVEFNRYILAGDLTKTIERVEQLQKQTEAAGGFVGMYL